MNSTPKEVVTAHDRLMVALNEWKDAGAPVGVVTMAIHDYIAVLLKEASPRRDSAP